MKKIIFAALISLCLFSQCTKDASFAPAYNNPVGQGGSLARFAIVGNYLYSVDEKKLKVFDISQPSSPVLKNNVFVGFEIETIFPFKDKLFIGSTSVVHIFSITDPVNPQKLSQAISPQVLRRCDPVVAKDTVAFATLRTNGPCGGIQSILAVFDIKDVENPIQKSSVPVSEPYGLGYMSKTLYVCDRILGLQVFDISRPYSPLLIQSLKDGSYIDVIPYNQTLICWVEDGVIIYDITDNTNPVLLAKII